MIPVLRGQEIPSLSTQHWGLRFVFNVTAARVEDLVDCIVDPVRVLVVLWQKTSQDLFGVFD